MDPLDELGGHVPELAEILDKARTARLTKDQVHPEIEEGASRLQSRVRTACAAYVEREAEDGTRLIIVVDQSEEAFTLCGSEEQRRLFVETLDAVSTHFEPFSADDNETTSEQEDLAVDKMERDAGGVPELTPPRSRACAGRPLAGS
jgi:hypothetical protein